MRLEADLALLQRAADTAGLALYPGAGNKTFPAGNITVAPVTLRALASELEERRTMPAEYRLIDYEAVWLAEAAHQLLLHRADGNEAKAERYLKLAIAMRAAVELDLSNATKSMERL